MSSVRQISLGGLLGALIALATLWFKVPGLTGYYHLGDGFVFAAAILLPPGVAGLAAAVGSSLADVLGGWGVWAPWTFVIKGLAALVTGLVARGGGASRRLVAMMFGALIITAGYALATWAMYGWAAVPAETYFNLAQTGVGIVVGMLLVTALRTALKSIR